MGSPTAIGIAASFPTRLRFFSGPGPDGSGSRLKTLRPQVPEKSGIALGAALPCPADNTHKMAVSSAAFAHA